MFVRLSGCEREEGVARGDGGIRVHMCVCVCVAVQRYASVDELGRRKMRQRFDPNGGDVFLICPPH